MRLLMLPLLLCSCFPLIGQNVVGGLPGKGMDMQAAPNGFVTQLPMAPAETKGDVYLNSEWILGDIVLLKQNSELKDYPIKFNLKTNDLEINYENQVKVLSGRSVSHFTLRRIDGASDIYLNAKNYKLNDAPISGFVKLIDSGKWELLSKSQVKLVKSNYVAALDAGDRSDTFVKEEVLYLAKDYKLYEIRLSQKKFAQQFKEDETEVAKFMKEKGISLKRMKDLIDLRYFLDQNI